MKILSEEFLKGLAEKYPRDYSFLARLARRRRKERSYISQINRMWSSLPENGRKDQGLIASLKSRKDDTFRGAMSELITHSIIKRYFDEIVYKPNLVGQTPDFYAATKDHSFVFETFSLGKNESEQREQLAVEIFSDEIRSIRARYFLWLKGTPILNASGHMNGLGEAIKRYLKTVKPDSPRDHYHFVEYKGASAGFHLHPKKSLSRIYAGHTGQIDMAIPTHDTHKQSQKEIEQVQVPVRCSLRCRFHPRC